MNFLGDQWMVIFLVVIGKIVSQERSYVSFVDLVNFYLNSCTLLSVLSGVIFTAAT